MSRKKIILIGGGGHCKACIDVIEQEGRFDIFGILDQPHKVGLEILGYPIIGSDGDLESLSKKVKNFFICVGQIGSPEIRLALYKLLKKYDLKLPVIISPFAYVSKHSVIGEGTIIMHHALINAGAKIGKNCIINSKALIEHDAIVEDHCHISTASVVNGGVKMGCGTFYGSGAVSKQYIKIKQNSFIRANQLVR